MKKSNYVHYVVLFSVMVWGALAEFQFYPWAIDRVADLSAQLEFVAHGVALVFLARIYSRMDRENRKTFLPFLIANIGLLINDLTYYISVYMPSNYLMNMAFLNFFVNVIPYFLWVIAMIMFMTQVLLKHVISRKKFFLEALFLVGVNILVLFVFLSSSHYAYADLSWQTLFQELGFMVDLIIFDFAILGLVYSEKRWMTLFLCGFIAIAAGDFLSDYTMLSQVNFLFASSSLLWFLGLLLIMWGAMTLWRYQDFEIAGWVRKDNTIKSRLAMWALCLSLVNVLPFFLIAYVFSFMRHDMFVGLPIFMMTYCVMVILASVLIGKHLELPFKKIEANIQTWMAGGDKTEVSAEFAISEFMFLQKFILNAFDLKLQKDEAVKALGEMSGQVAHDIRSPLGAMKVLMRRADGMPEQSRILLRQALMRIEDIANNLVLAYQGKAIDLGQSRKPYLVSLVLESLASEKRLQWESQDLDLVVDIEESARFAFVELNQSEFKRMISNVLNNAMEAKQADRSLVITMRLARVEGEVQVMVQDNGKGMPPVVLEKIRKWGGTFGKDNGCGLGLRHTFDTLHGMGGRLDFASQEGVGTILTLKLTPVEAPDWFMDTLVLEPQASIVILDDDESIHTLWDIQLAPLKHQLLIQHFQDPDVCLAYLKKQDLQKPHVFLFDYELIGQTISGLDLAKKFPEVQTVLVTSHYEKQVVIDACQEAHAKLLPKGLVSALPVRFKS